MEENIKIATYWKDNERYSLEHIINKHGERIDLLDSNRYEKISVSIYNTKDTFDRIEQMGKNLKQQKYQLGKVYNFMYKL